MSKLQFDIAVADVQAAEEDRATLALTPVTIAGEDYACVRPAPGAFVEMLNIAHQVRAKTIDQAVGVLLFLNECFDETVLRAAIAESGRYDATDSDPEHAEFNEEGERLAKSNSHIYGRFRSHDDDLGTATLADVMIGLCEHWSGNPTGLPPASTGGRSGSGATSTARPSRKASTSRASRAKARPASARRSTS